MKNLNEIIDRYIGDNIVGNIAVRVGIGDRIIHDSFCGQADKYTLFDMASVTKIMFPLRENTVKSIMERSWL